MNTQEQTKKTNGKWYMMLPEPYRMQAINNAERDNMLGGEASSLGEALLPFHGIQRLKDINTGRRFLKK